jgi:hypothetical protein
MSSSPQKQPIAEANTEKANKNLKLSSYNNAVGRLIGIVAIVALIYYFNAQKEGSTSIPGTNNIRSTAPEVLVKGVGTLDQLGKKLSGKEPERGVSWVRGNTNPLINYAVWG